ncbi:hypothetical protein KUTeg_009802 [Tegillarca granosa]|uniref:Cyclic nucleotide-binding domain-containing protein n=1 Tax=Tegillarca granosa TaxID=220873 RepID=A0ABQ9F4X7_TEGGR|nr:hypothetical protein KUTeg_009802 [Tegillarca granosa]
MFQKIYFKTRKIKMSAIDIEISPESIDIELTAKSEPNRNENPEERKQSVTSVGSSTSTKLRSKATLISKFQRRNNASSPSTSATNTSNTNLIARRWRSVRHAVKVSNAVSMSKKKSPVAREDSFLKKFSTRNQYRSDSDVSTEDTNKSETVTQNENFTKTSVIRPDGNFMFYWLGVLTLAVLYNLWTCIARQAFYEIHQGRLHIWISFDILCDIIYILDIVVQFRTGYLDQGLMVYDSSKLARNYLKSKCLYLDFLCLIPLDLIQFQIGVHPMIRFPRFVKIYRTFRFVHMLESRTAYPNFVRVANLTHILFLGSHWFAAFYYMISEAEEFYGDWSYPKPEGEFQSVTRKYLASLFWSTLTLTTIGDLPPPETNWDYKPRQYRETANVKTVYNLFKLNPIQIAAMCQLFLPTIYVWKNQSSSGFNKVLKNNVNSIGFPSALFLKSSNNTKRMKTQFFINYVKKILSPGYVFVIVSYLIGVFIFATIVGQVGNVINNRNASRQEFERLLDGAKLYMQMHNVPNELQKRVQRWYDYVWTRGRMKGSDINSLGLLPDKLKTELAIHVNLETLKKVTIFQECQPEFLHDLVLKMRAYIFTPGDLICRRGEIAREMFIIADGVVEIISESGTILTQMSTGDFFGEIGILNLDGGINRRTADVRSVGYSELFVLSREDVLGALKDHPEAENIIREYGQKRLKEIEEHRQKLKTSNGSLERMYYESVKELKEITTQQHILLQCVQKTQHSVEESNGLTSDSKQQQSNSAEKRKKYYLPIQKHQK